MTKTTVAYVCQACGANYPKWTGRCEACGGWNTVGEELRLGGKGRGKAAETLASGLELISLADAVSCEAAERLRSGIAEFDRVTGGGLVPGSVLLVGGDPGIGKSTLLLQVAHALGKDCKVAYISGEESADQIRSRAFRLGVDSPNLLLASSGHLDRIIRTGERHKDLKVMVIDSIQTVSSEYIDSAAGTVGQVRTCTQELIRMAKTENIAVILVGHVTKEGTLAGPRVMEHMVDTVLYFEGDRHYDFRLLRAVKNRFGATDELGIFTMSAAGLTGVDNPSGLFLADEQQRVSGSAVFAGLEGTRPILCEIQALVANSYLSMPRRTAVGWDPGRLSMLLAVLESRCGLSFAGKDVYLNIAGGLKITDPAADLAVAAALASAMRNLPLPRDAVFFGEISLSAAVRPVRHPQLRLKEAARLGFTQAYLAQGKSAASAAEPDIRIHALSHLHKLLREFAE